jgi:hypothetical protein
MSTTKQKKGSKYVYNRAMNNKRRGSDHVAEILNLVHLKLIV